MRLSTKEIIVSIILIFIQLIINNYLNLGSYITISLLPFLILALSYSNNTIKSMLIAFGIGLLVDLLGDGVLGFNAATLTAVALTRKTFLKWVITEQNYSKTDRPSVKSIGLAYYSIFTLLSLLLYFIVYVFMENMGFSHFGFSLLRILIGTVLNTILMLLLSAIIQNRRE